MTPAEMQHEIDGLTETVIRQGEMLRQIVIAVRGDPPADTAWSTHDAAELVQDMVAGLDAARQASRYEADLAQQAIDALNVITAERDEADRRAGASERMRASEIERLAAFMTSLREMKQQWGVDNNVSFDEVWRQALAARSQLQTLRGPVMADEVVDWRLTGAEIGAQFRTMAKSVKRLRQALEDIISDSGDLGARECAQDALDEVGGPA